MLELSKVIQQYPQSLHDHREHILREYIQYHILELIFSSAYGQKLCFIWWTALRLVYNNQRFSEDLDFDVKNLSYWEFEAMIAYIKNWLAQRWREVELRCVRKWAFHAHIKFPNILFENNLASMPTAKILIQIDTVDQWYDFEPDKILMTKFETQALCRVASPSLLLAQKLFTVFERKRMRWRDFFDILFLLKKTQSPDYKYLEQKKGIWNSQKLKNYLSENTKTLDLALLQRDVAPFLFDSHDQSVLLFRDIIERIEWGE